MIFILVTYISFTRCTQFYSPIKHGSKTDRENHETEVLSYTYSLLHMVLFVCLAQKDIRTYKKRMRLITQ